MFDLAVLALPPDAWPALALPLYAMGASAVVGILAVVFLVGAARQERRLARVTRLEGTRAA